MTQEEELNFLRSENGALRIMLRKHRAMGEEAESDARSLRFHVQKVSDLLKSLIAQDDPNCRRCAKALAEITKCLKDLDSQSQDH